MDWSSPVIRLVGIGWYIAITIALGTIGGVWLDDLASTDPLFTLLGLFLSLAVALVGAYRMLAETVLNRGNRRGH